MLLGCGKYSLMYARRTPVPSSSPPPQPSSPTHGPAPVYESHWPSPIASVSGGDVPGAGLRDREAGVRDRRLVPGVSAGRQAGSADRQPACPPWCANREASIPSPRPDRVS